MAENTQKSFSLTAAPCVLVLISGIFLCSFLFALQSFAAATKGNTLESRLATIRGDYWLGEVFEERNIIETCIRDLRNILNEMDKNEDPELRSSAQFYLGAALATLDQWTASSDHCEEATAAFRAALQGRTQEEISPEWAQLHRYFGYALSSCGETKKDAGLLKEAIPTLQYAIKNIPQGKGAKIWDTRAWYLSQINLGKVFCTLGTLEKNLQHLDTCADLCKMIATEELYRWSPAVWKKMQDTLFFFLDDLGTKYYDDASASSEQKAKGFQLKQESLDIGAAVIQKIASEIPLKEWAGRQLLLGFRYITFSLRCFEEGDEKNAEIKATAALNILQHTLTRITYKELPEEWTKCIGYAALTLYQRGAVTRNLGDLEQATAYCINALEIVTKDSEKQTIRRIMFRAITDTAIYMHFLLPS